MGSNTMKVQAAKDEAKRLSLEQKDEFMGAIHTGGGIYYGVIVGDRSVRSHMNGNFHNVISYWKNGVEYDTPFVNLINALVPKNPELQVITVKIVGGNVTSVEGVPAGHKVIILDDYVEGLDEDDSQIITDDAGKQFYYYAEEYHANPDGHSNNPINRLDV